MSENKFKKIMEILEKVIKINAVKGTKIVADLDHNGLHVYDVNNDCKSIIDDTVTHRIYFGELWDNEFDNLVSEMNKALDQYLV